MGETVCSGVRLLKSGIAEGGGASFPSDGSWNGGSEVSAVSERRRSAAGTSYQRKYPCY